MRKRRRRVGALVSLAVVTVSCSLGPREEWADQIHDADRTARAAHTAKVHVSVGFRVIETTIREVPKPIFETMDGIVDFRARRSRLVVTAPAERRASVAIFHGLVDYFQRSKASIGRSKKRWVKFDFTEEPRVDIDINDRRLGLGVDSISPVLAVELLHGVLTGSIDRAESSSGAGVSTYIAKLSQDAAVRDIRDDDRQKGMVRVFQNLGVSDDIFPVKVSIDGQGRPKDVRFVLKQQKDRVNVYEMTIHWTFSDYGVPVKIALPKPEETAVSTRFQNFVIEAVRVSI